MTDVFQNPHSILPTLAIDSRGRLLAVVVSRALVGVCLTRIGEEPLTTSTYMDRLHEEPWITLVREHDGVFFVTLAGLIPSDTMPDPELMKRPASQEAVHIAIEIGLSAWPEWGDDLRHRFTPKPTIHVHLTGEPLHA